MEDGERIQEGKYLLLQRGDYQRIVHFKAHETITFGKGQSQQDVQLKNALGHEYYSAFRILPLPLDQYPPPPPEKDPSSEGSKGKGGRRGNRPQSQKKLFFLEKVEEPASRSFSQLTFDTLTTPVPSGKDNRNLLDDRTSQSLGESDVRSLKDQGLSTKVILNTIISSSKSFSQKTEFSQEKYLKKKEKTHGDLLLITKPDLFSVSEYLFKKDPSRILGMRMDTLSQILSYANIHAKGRYIVYENALGLLVSAVLERMGGFGTLLHCHAGTHPQKQGISYLNLSDEVLKPLNDLDVFYLIKGRGVKAKAPSADADTDGDISTNGKSEDNKEPEIKKRKTEEDETEMEIPVEDDPTPTPTPTLSNREMNELSLNLLASPFHSLIICAKEHPLSILQRLLPHLQLSAPFVVYSAFSEPLMECYNWVKETRVGANVQIVENWLRNIQVETDRTHPEINMSSSGGYILFGTYVRDSTPNV